MDRPVNLIYGLNLELEGACMGLSIQLIAVCLFSSSQNHKWQIRALKILMAIGVFLKSLLFGSFNISVESKACVVSGRVGNTFNHVAIVAAMSILLLRVMAIVPDKYYTLFTIFHTFLILLRIFCSVLDIISVDISLSNLGTCVFREKYKLVAASTIYNCVIDVYVSMMVILILTKHIRKIRPLGIAGNVNLYTSVVLANATRTVILTGFNVFYATYIIKNIYDPIGLYIIWPFHSISLIVLVGYDTNITHVYQKLQSESETQEEQDLRKQSNVRNSFFSNTSSTPSTSKPGFSRRLSLNLSSDRESMLQSNSSICDNQPDQQSYSQGSYSQQSYNDQSFNQYSHNFQQESRHSSYHQQGDIDVPFTVLEMTERDTTNHTYDNGSSVDTQKTL